MGMIPGTFIVKEGASKASEAEVKEELNKISMPTGGSCGGG